MPLEEKILNGKAKPPDLEDHKITNLEGITVPEPRDYLDKEQKVQIQTRAKEIYESMYQWLVKMGCADRVNPDLIEQYSQSYARYIQVETIISATGFLAKHPTTGAAMQSPYVMMSELFLKQSVRAYMQIDEVVKSNVEAGYMPFTSDLKEIEGFLTK